MHGSEDMAAKSSNHATRLMGYIGTGKVQLSPVDIALLNKVMKQGVFYYLGLPFHDTFVPLVATRLMMCLHRWQKRIWDMFKQLCDETYGK
jgi:hypothetical protein